MKRSYRITGYVLGGIGLLVLLAVAALLTLTRTEYGLERVRVLVLDRLARQINGELRVGRIASTTGLLRDLMLYDVAIDDPDGQPFLRADSARLGYDVRTLIGGEIVLDPVVLFDPEVFLTRLPGDTAWNYQRIFPDTAPDVAPARLVLLEDAAIHDGRVEIRMPLDPGLDLTQENRERMILEAAPGGTVRVMRMERVNATLPSVVWSSPREKGRLIRVSDLSALAYVWNTPADVRQLRSTVAVQDSIISFETPVARLPGSRLQATGRLVLGAERRYDILVDGEELVFEDFQWLYPDFPEEGGGELRLRMQTQPGGRTLWLVQDARLRTPGSVVAGSFGVVTGDTMYLTQVDLTADPLDMDLVRRLLPVEIPIEGLVVGNVRIEGPISSLHTEGDVRLARRGGPDSSVRWEGTVDLDGGFAARDLRADIRRLDLALLEAVRPGLGARGVVSGRVDASGGKGSMRFAGLLRHRAPGGVESVVQGSGRWSARRGGDALTVRFDAESVELAGLAESFPALAGLRGVARGPVRLSGTTTDLGVEADLETDAGPVTVRGRLDLSGPAPAFALEGRVSAFRLDRLLGGALAATELTGAVRLEGRGAGVADADVRIRTDLERGSYGGVELYGGTLRARLRDGRLQVDSLSLASAAGRLLARGDLGVAEGRSGRLDWTLQADSLRGLQPLLFPGAAGDTVLVAGRLRATGALEGRLGDLGLGAEARLEHGLYASHYLDGAARLEARHLGTDSARTIATLAADSARLFDRPLTSARARLDLGPAGGGVEAEATAAGERAYAVAGGFTRADTGAEVRLRTLDVRDPDHSWSLPAEAVLRVDAEAITVSGFDLRRAAGTGRVFAEGRLPWGTRRDSASVAARRADFRVGLEGVPLEDLLAVAWPGADADGTLAGALRLSGPAAAPRLVADLTVGDLRFEDLRLQRVGARALYADRRLEVHAAAAEPNGRISLSADGVVPVDLSLVPGVERHTGERIDVSVRADSLSAAVPMALLDGYRNVVGRIDGALHVGGTTREPVLAGSAAIGQAGFDVDAGGVRVRDVDARLRLLDGNVLAVDGFARSGDGWARVGGSLTFDRLADPAFDLDVTANAFEAARRRDIDLVASGSLRLGGRFTQPRLSGRWQVDGGALYLDELVREYQIVDLESALFFDVVDTTQVAYRPIVTSPFLRNLVVDATIDVGRDFWLRSRELNAEVSGQLGVAFDRRAEDLRLTGSLSAVRGTYQILTRRFQVRQGTVEFTGAPGVNPELDIVAGYRAPIGQGEARDVLDIYALVSGTLLSPRVSLSNDTTGAQPTIGESDLASYLVFGQPTSALTRTETQALSAAGIGLFAPSALGVGASILQSVGQRLFGVDYVSITAGDVAGAGTPGMLSSLQTAEVEVGRYWNDLYLAYSRRIAGNSGWGTRVEYRLDPWLTSEIFYEKGLDRGPRIGLDPALQDREKYGVFLFREWSF